ncbi:MAG: hypothetical protein HON68_02545 [Gammaproteobacteria bacterium]|jgi:hypothetical protein|nr:hypothetical protein [Gammaproteobacteria bacterium]MBT3488936.1 hypothetical protein [Gammaproteobacteria bacterium]MBT3719381.1 hypothetical protein [Gammaproteobacteria bacterium]MBT3844572.1 hypothetical protein [Gammaproteobacteria bacterium]MBT3893759.1 hypothetical protein [Gammaproteobacteria bacterium]
MSVETSLSAMIQARRKLLEEFLSPTMKGLAEQIVPFWSDQQHLSDLLGRALQPWAELSFAERLYAIFPSGVLHSRVMSCEGGAENQRIRFDSLRDYLYKVNPLQLQLTEVYISPALHRSCITAIQPLYDGIQTIGYVVGDFDLRRLPQEEKALFPQATWRQIKGDPAIRQQLFHQRFTPRAIDEYIDDVISILDELVVERGIFRASLRFSSSRATLWVEEDPYDEHTHVLNEILDPSICLAYPRRPYPERAKVLTDMVRPILERFRELRRADDVVYLRTGTLNIISGLVEVNFSCDGTHLMPAEMFLEKDETFWFGNSFTKE